MGIPQRDQAHSRPLESLVLTILSQNTTDTNSFKAFNALKNAFHGADGTIDWQQLVDAPREDIADVIRTGGLANQKSERIQNILCWIKREYGDYNIDFICDMDPLDVVNLFTTQKGIGVKTISVVLAFCCGAAIFPVDTHIHRICRRLGLVDDKFTAEKTFWAMQELVPKGKSFSFHMNLIYFGRIICQARKPLCEECPLTDECKR